MGQDAIITKAKRAYVSSVPGAPGNNATVVLFCTHPRAAGGSGAVELPSSFVRGSGKAAWIDPDAIQKVMVTYHQNNQASAANGLRAYVTPDGLTWLETDLKNDSNTATIGSAASVQIPVLSAGQEYCKTFDVSKYRGFALEHTAGAAGPTEWKLTIAVEYLPPSE